MKRSAVLCLACLFVALTNGPWGFASPDNLLPSSGLPTQWVLDGPVNRYTAENLYIYINGEAELFMPYGFQVLNSALFVDRDRPGTGLVADVYVMGSLLDAFGIYSSYRDPDAVAATVGAQGFVTDSQLMFFKDRHFVRLSGSGEKDPDRDSFLAFAQAIVRHLPGSDAVPPEIRLLSIPGVVVNSIRYVGQSVLGYGFFRKGLTADAEVEGQTARVFVVLAGSPDGAAKTMDEYDRHLRGAGVEPRVIRKEATVTLIAMDPLYKGTGVRQSGQYLIGVARLRDGMDGIALIDALEGRIRGAGP